MSIAFTDLFSHLNWLLKDIPETGTRGNAFSRLSADVALIITNMMTDSLVKENHQRFIREYPLAINTTALTGNVDTTGKILTLGNDICRLISIKAPTDTSFSLISDFVTSDTIRKYSDTQIYNDDGWTHGDIYALSAVVFPTHAAYHPATTNPVAAAYYDDIQFPREWFDLLSMSIADYVLSRAGQEPTISFTQQLMNLKRLWKLDTGKITERTKVYNKRTGIGS